jgi:NAD(P)-dependent dehydrogenase (short-subunit alcohol dehydrogenase family)
MEQRAFAGKSVLITGASRGIGRAMALQLAEQGAWLTLAARGTEELEHVAASCRERGARSIAVSADVSREADCKLLVARAVAEYGRLDVLISNAGLGLIARFEDLPNPSAMETVMAVDFWGSVYCIYHALPHLRESRGRIVAVVSGTGKLPAPGASGYSAAKHALAAFVGALRIELQDSGITFTAAFPEWVETGFTARAITHDGTPSGVPSPHEKGAMTPEECARQILKAAAERRREMISPKIKLGIILAQFLPEVVDDISVRVFT